MWWNRFVVGVVVVVVVENYFGIFAFVKRMLGVEKGGNGGKGNGLAWLFVWLTMLNYLVWLCSTCCFCKKNCLEIIYVESVTEKKLNTIEKQNKLVILDCCKNFEHTTQTEIGRKEMLLWNRKKKKRFKLLQ